MPCSQPPPMSLPEGSRRHITVLLGAPRLEDLDMSELFDAPTLPFLPPLPNPEASRIEDYLGSAPFPTLSTFNPSGTGRSTRSCGAQGTDLVRHVLVEGDNNEVTASARPPARNILPISSSRMKTAEIPAWRRLPLEQPPLHTGFTQNIYDATPSIYAWERRCKSAFVVEGEGNNELEDRLANATSQVEKPADMQAAEGDILPEGTQATFFDTQATVPDDSVLAEHSYAVFNLTTSQLPAPTSSEPTAAAEPITAAAENGDTTTTFYPADSNPPPLPPIPLSKLSSLTALPTPVQLLNKFRNYTATLLVGIMKVKQQKLESSYANPRTGTKGEWDLFTFIVGDETFAGLQVKIWLPALRTTAAAAAAAGGGPSSQDEDVNPNSISNLTKCRYFKRGDIVLFQDLLLSAFKGVTYANSMHGERTKAALVYRDSPGYRADLEGDSTTRERDPTVDKVWRVRQWVRRIVGYQEVSDINLDSIVSWKGPI